VVNKLKNIKEIIKATPELKDLNSFNEAQLIELCLAAGVNLQKFKPQKAGELLQKEIKERDMLLGYLIQSQMIVNFTAPSGICKSWLAMYLCVAMATGGTGLGLKAPKPRKIVYLDAEMPEIDAQTRMGCFASGLVGELLKLFEANFSIMNIDGVGQELPDLTSLLAQRIVSHYCKDVDVLVIDNFISVFTETDDKDDIKMKQFTNWLRELRKSGLTIITINHTTKEGKRLGSVILDTYNDLTIDIREPKPDSKGPNKDIKKDYLSFIFSKARHLTAEQKETFYFKFNIDESGVSFWKVQPET
jgi:putative DNA primase/helicase